MASPEPNSPPSFPEYPQLYQLIYRHTPGFDYAIVLAANIARFTTGGWTQVQSVPPFMVRDQTMLLLRKGEPLWGTSADECLPHYYVDIDADRALGIVNLERLDDSQPSARYRAVRPTVAPPKEPKHGNDLPPAA